MDNKDGKNYAQMLITTLQKQEKTLQEVLLVTKRQGELANMPEFDEDLFEETLSRKDILIARLNELDDGFTKLYNRVHKEIIEHKDTYNEEILKMRELIKQCTDLGVEIRVLEERNRDKLVQCFMSKNKKYGAQVNAATVASKYHRTMKTQSIDGSNYTL